MHFISVLDKATAELIEQVLPWCINFEYVLKDAVGEAINYGQWLSLEEAGFLTFGGSMLTKSHQPNEQNIVVFRSAARGFIARFPDQTVRNLAAVKFTRIGTELAATIPSTFQEKAISKYLWSLKPTELWVADIVEHEGGTEEFDTAQYVANPNS